MDLTCHGEQTFTLHYKDSVREYTTGSVAVILDGVTYAGPGLSNSIISSTLETILGDVGDTRSLSGVRTSESTVRDFTFSPLRLTGTYFLFVLYS